MKMKKLLKLCSLFLVMTICLSMAAVVVSADTTEFVDVDETDYFYPAIQWGVEAGITYGVDENRFDPQGEVNRAQVVTFLWRMVGQPTPTTTETFADVDAGSWYETAVAWAVENKITLGTGEGMFSPDEICDRAMCITLLYRIMGSPLDAADAAEPIEFSIDMTLEELGISMSQQLIAMIRDADVFEDVQEGAYYELAVIWGCISGIITEDNTGILEQGGMFRAADPCVRKEMISFLYQTKLMQDAANAPEIYEVGPISISFPQEYSPLLYREMYGIGDDEDGVIIVVSELASREAAEAMGEDPEGAGELFSIVRVGEDELHEMLCGDMSGAEVFAKDEDGKYYLFSHPTDVRYMRETTEQMTEDQDQWTELNSWANGIVGDDIIRYSKGLSPVTFTNTMLDMYLARIAYKKDINYTISTTEFGPLEPGSLDTTPYVEFLLSGNFAEAEDAKAPDGEYVVLSFPDEDVRYDFFTGDKNLVREIRGEYETFYERSFYDSVSNTEAMQGWYNAIAEQAGKKEADKSLDAFIGTWYEQIAGRGVLTITRSVASGKVNIEASWPDSAFVMHTWDITADFTEDGTLVYTEGKHIVTEFDETGESRVIFEDTGESGSIALNSEGKIIWNYKVEDQSEEGVFICAD